MNIPFLNPAAQFSTLRGPLLEAAERVLAKGHYILGPEVAACEQEVAALGGARHGIGVNSGSDALTVALRALGIGPGDEVITTPFTYIAPAEAIHQTGARIVFADIDPVHFILDPAEVARRITPRTKAILPVHLFGQAAPVEAYATHGLPVIEDAAQAIGAARNGIPVGSLGIAACFSFYPTKNLGACGDGGMITTSDDAFVREARRLRVHGMERRYHHDVHGYNTRLDELQAALLRVKLTRLAEWNRRRGELAARYSAGLAGLPLQTPSAAAGNRHVWHVYALLSDDRDALQAHLAANGVPVLIYYPAPLHLQPCYADYGWRTGDQPVAESVSKRILPLPMYPELSDEQADYVIGRVRAFFEQ
jgi:dTDP-4-amino-4,6-dideoxygalactose transaminase